MLQLEDEDSVERGFKRLSSLYQLPQSQRCQRCGQTVYQQEKLGPVNDVIFHKQCFRCCVCGTYVTMKNYWTNQTSSEDKEVYCQTHAPRIGGSMLDNKSMGIMSALTAQDNFRKANTKMTELRFQSDQHSPTLDREAVGRQLSPGLGKDPSYGQPKFTIDENAVHIRGALDAQLLQRRYERKLDKHHFPPHIVKKREQLFETQKRLEEKLREEEDQMFNEFRQEREKEDKAINKEIDSEWEQQLQQLTEKYQTMMDKKKKKIKDSDKKIMTVQFENEKKDLAATMTSRKQNKKKTMTLRLRQKEQEQTAQLVKKQSQVMLEMLAKEQQVLKAELAREIARVPPFVHDSQETTLLDGGKKEIEQVLEEILTLPSVREPPSPNPPKCRKAELFTETSVFSYIDKQVIKVAESEQLTYTDLVRQLTEDLVTDLEKARAIYRWICVKDLNVMEFADNLDADTPLGLLRGIKFGTETYHVLFLRLCSYAGLHCVEIKGHSKSVGYEPGMKITPDTFQNTWNAVLIGGDWRLIQCNWGARHLVLSKDKEDKKRGGNDQIRYQYDDHYFLTDPDEFIQEFWPLDPKWQLLKSPISLGEFEALPFVRSIFFHYKMHFDGHKRAVIDTDDKGGARIAIRVPEEYENDLVFYYQLRFADKEKGKELTYRGALLERYVFQTMLENTLTFNIHVPTAGNYFMEIFANKIDDSGRVEENNASVAPFKLKCACKFKVVCKTLTGTMHPLPNCAAGEWGPKKAQRHFGIMPIISPSPNIDMEKLGMLTVDDHFELKFRSPHPYQFVAKLRMNGVDSHALDPFVKLSSEGSVLSVSVTLPQPGQYGLDIFARPKGATDKNTLSHACKYLINCSSVSSFIELPKSSSTSSSSSSSHSEAKSIKSGPTSTFDELGLKVLSPRDTRTCVTRSNVSVIDISCPPHIVLSYQFVREPDEDNRDYVQQSHDGHGITRFKMTFHQKGNYILRLYARKERSENRSAPNVFNYVIRYAPDDSVDVVNGDKKALFLKRSVFSRTNSKDSSSIDST